MASPVPLPPYASALTAKRTSGNGNSSSSRIMARNSAIQRAQREWEQTNKDVGKGTDGKDDLKNSSASSESSASEESQSPGQPPPRVETKVYPPVPPMAGVKRNAETASLGSSQAAKRLSSAPDTTAKVTTPNQRSDHADTRRASKSDTSSRSSMSKKSTSSEEALVYRESDSITLRADGSPYGSYVSDLGHSTHVGSVLLPTNYRISSKPPVYHCPDRECGKIFNSWLSLGGHFSAGHKGLAYNDNCDGTLTKLGIYKKTSGQVGRAIIVSQINKRSSSSSSSASTTSVSSASSASSSSAAPGAAASPSPSVSDDSLSEAFTHVSSLLSSHVDYRQYLSKPYMRVLSRLPKRRDLPPSWAGFHFGKEASEETFALALAYMTGHEPVGAACSALEQLVGMDKEVRPGKTPVGWKTVLFPVELAASGLQERPFGLDSCVGCCYYTVNFDVTNRCIIHMEEEAQERKRRELAARESERRKSWRERMEQLQGSAAAAAAAAATAGASSLPLRDVAARDKEEEEEVPLIEEHRRLTRGMAAARSSGRSDVQGPSSLSSKAATSQRLASSQVPSNQMAMEEWEIAPGHVVDSKHGENVAYSNAYLSGREPVDVSQDIAFNVMAIKPGDRGRWEATETEVRIFSVASGKVEVKLGAGGGCRFVVGPNGVFLVRPGEVCVVSNRMYVDATVHCTTVRNYSIGS